ncbi:MAG: hypothetical protein C4519_11990 [Desulfobacteraceae bacterium]|nr:MAG: hypothetical protein C4519_11990 [Desulfobacteraceae bacterium]
MANNNFYGYWRIVEMEMWDQEFIDAEVPGYIEFNKHEMGLFQFGYLRGSMDCRFSKKDNKDFVEFSWEGNDEMDPALGRGFASIEGDVLIGHLFIHEGDDSEFKAKKEIKKLK